jgi:hypothetical protein
MASENSFGDEYALREERDEGAKESSILDDMDKFQREIDELKARYEKEKGKAG